MPPLIEIICVSYKQPGPLKVLVQSFLNQTADNWRLVVVHDGPDAEFDALMAAYKKEGNGRIRYWSTETRFNDWGHTLRDMGIKKARGDYVLLTNGDNYYVPKFIEMVTRGIEETNPDVVLFDMVHNYQNAGLTISPPYTTLKTKLAWGFIDVGSAVVRTKLARAVGFRDKTAGGDQVYFADLQGHSDLKVCKINSVLFIHN
jgi:glycosyltransferase involved in cell wall biosynthesis